MPALVKFGAEDGSWSFIKGGAETEALSGAAQTGQQVASVGTSVEQREHLGITEHAYDDWRKSLLAGAILCKSQFRLKAHRLPCVIETAKNSGQRFLIKKICPKNRFIYQPPPPS